MKKNLILGLTVLAVVGGVLTGCGNEKDVTKVDDTQAVVTESTQAALEKDLEPAVPETTEEVTEAPTEETVKADFLEENGITITPNGDMTLPLAVTDTDDVTDVSVSTSVATVTSSEEGYSDTTFVAKMSNAKSDFSYYATAFDRYTGVDFEGKHTDFGTSGGSTHQDVAVIDVDGKQYDCSLTADQYLEDGKTVLKVVIHHPSEYDGVVFQLGKGTKTIFATSETIDYTQAFKITDYAGMLDGQYFFTATDK